MKELREKIFSPTYHFVKFQNKLYGEINNFITDTEGMTQSRLAEKLGVTKGYISQIINSGADHKLSKLIKLSLAIGKIPQIELLDPEKYVEGEINRRKDKLPLALDELKENICQHSAELEIRKDDQEEELISIAKAYSEY